MTPGGTPGNTETFDMVLTRTFDASVGEVWKAWTEGDYIHSVVGTEWVHRSGRRDGRARGRGVSRGDASSR